MKMQFFKNLIPSSILKFLRPIYHGLVSVLANWYFGRPSEMLIVIGVTGTNGKTTTVNLIARILNEAGLKAGYVSTATLNIDGKEILNPAKITMPSGWFLHKAMANMLKNNCKYAVLEVSSEGLFQNRHLGINFDLAVFTNLTPEHIEAHGGFENYKQAKARLFRAIGQNQVTEGKRAIWLEAKKIIITNTDDEHGKFYAKFKADKHVTYGMFSDADYFAAEADYKPKGVSYTLITKPSEKAEENKPLKTESLRVNLQLKGLFDVYNSLAAIATANALGVELLVCKSALENAEVVPGRVEVIQNFPYTVVVDYAYEPEEMRQLYETLQWWPHKRVIQVLGPCGGGRDQARIPILGQMAGKFADIVIVTTDDPYDDDPSKLGDLMLGGIAGSGKERDKSLFKILDRRAAIVKAIQLVAQGDIILITGKGADQSMAIENGKYLPWDDRKVVKEEIGFMLLNRNKHLDHIKEHDFIH